MSLLHQHNWRNRLQWNVNKIHVAESSNRCECGYVRSRNLKCSWLDCVSLISEDSFFDRDILKLLHAKKNMKKKNQHNMRLERNGFVSYDSWNVWRHAKLIANTLHESLYPTFNNQTHNLQVGIELKTCHVVCVLGVVKWMFWRDRIQIIFVANVMQQKKLVWALIENLRIVLGLSCKYFLLRIVLSKIKFHRTFACVCILWLSCVAWREYRMCELRNFCVCMYFFNFPVHFCWSYQKNSSGKCTPIHLLEEFFGVACIIFHFMPALWSF
jgi:hypothetical protein